MLLSRIAWKLYWIGCNVQRAEDNARAALAQKTVSKRLGAGAVPLARELLASLDNVPEGGPDEDRCVQYLLTDRENPFSSAASLGLAYTDVRSLQSILPGEAWSRVQSLRQKAAGLSGAGPTVLQERLEDFIRTALAFAGVLSTGMLRDHGYLFWQAGRQLAAAEITCALVRACLSCQSDEAEDTVSDSMVWVQVLHSLGMLESYRRISRTSVAGSDAARFMVREGRVGHSVSACLSKAATAVSALPNNGGLLRSLSRCGEAMRGFGTRQDRSLQSLARLGSRIDATMALVGRTYFPKL